MPTPDSIRQRSRSSQESFDATAAPAMTSAELDIQVTEHDYDEIMAGPDSWQLQSTQADTISGEFSSEAREGHEQHQQQHQPGQQHQSDHQQQQPQGGDKSARRGCGASPVAIPSCSAQAKDTVDGQCVQECCHMVTDLEDYLIAGVSAFKIILNVIRHALKKLHGLIGMQQTSRNPRCLMLFATIMYQVLGLLQVGYGDLIASKHKDQPSSLRGLGGGLGLVGCAADIEDRLALRTQAFARELQHGLELVNQVSALAGGHDATSSAVAIQARVDCYHDLRTQLGELLRQVTKRNL
ncbi:hypothetical protein B0I35DRAFT_440799 [Stachybotrys elegans]|uniref:Uncharacterized protein n=1 Tax=Stachybotrys elegans TaxID=80388 RepID=A0A8K0SES1_9HYPO|nr:hypothetical protein B0I35DRAFT_440799 [Stachybotrys elegans]